MKIQHFIVLLAGLFWGSTIISQVQAQNAINQVDRVGFMTEYYWHMPSYNPAFTGESSLPSILLSAGFGKEYDNKPRTFNLLAHGHIESATSGVGVKAFYHKFDDKISATGTSGSVGKDSNRNILELAFLYSYKMDIGDNGYFRFGAAMAALHYESGLVPNTPTTTTTTQVSVNNEKYFKPKIDFGLMVRYYGFYTGVSMVNANEVKFQFATGGTGANGQNFRRTGFVTLGYDLRLSEDRIGISPSMMLNFLAGSNGNNFDKAAINVNLLLDYNQLAYLGFSYKANDPPYIFNSPYYGSIILGGRLSDFHISMAYNLTKSVYSESYARIEATLGLFLGGRYYEDEDE